MKYTIALMLVLIIISSCATSKKAVRSQADDTQTKSGYDESFDPLTLQDDDIVIVRETKEKAPRQSVKAEQEISLTSANTEVDGFRVQILATRSIEAATMAKQQAEEQFAPYKYKVYWSFEAPFYRIRVGDVIKRTDAEAIRDLAKEMGYKQAFPVRSKVKPPQEKP